MLIPEPLIDPMIPLDRKRRKSLYKAAWRKWYNKPLHILLYLVGLSASFSVLKYLPTAIRSMRGQSSWFELPLALIIYCVLLYLLYTIMRRFHFAPLVYAELRSSGFDVCPKCGYWLRDLDETIANCPECGCVRTALTSTSSSTTKE